MAIQQPSAGSSSVIQVEENRQRLSPDVMKAGGSDYRDPLPDCSSISATCKRKLLNRSSHIIVFGKQGCFLYFSGGVESKKCCKQRLRLSR